jgi:Ca-activated chloride channel family protein
MRFAALPYLYLLWLVPALLALSIYAFGRKRQALAEFMELDLAPRLLPDASRLRQWLKALCLLGAVAALIVALTQPQWGKHWQDVPRRGRDLMILLDVSRSMLANDIAPIASTALRSTSRIWCACCTVKAVTAWVSSPLRAAPVCSVH